MLRSKFSPPPMHQSAPPPPSTSVSYSSSVRKCSPLAGATTWLLSSGVPTTVYVQLPDDRPYRALLRQTEIVYDQLLSERKRKLQQKINERQSQYLEKYGQLLSTDPAKASEFERWAIAALSKLKDECSEELKELRQDYESKFVKMRISLEEQLMADNNYSPNAFKTSRLQPQQQTHLANRH